MANRNPNNRQDGNHNKPKYSIIALILLVFVFTFFGNQIYRLFTASKEEQVTYDRFLTAAKDDLIQSAEISSDQIVYTLREDVENEKKMLYYTTRLSGVDLTAVVDTMQANGVKFEGVLPEDDTFFKYFSGFVTLFIHFIVDHSSDFAHSGFFPCNADCRKPLRRRRPRRSWKYRQEQGKGLYGKGNRRDLQGCGGAG